MSTTTIDEKTQEVLKRDESKIIKALEIYYSRFGTEHNITFQGAALKVGANPAFIVNYFFYCPAYIGIPETREEAQTYLKNLLGYKKSRSL